ncbi:MAG: EamA family transporter [Sneathiella sp.]|nr:MAG: EamA family transporter [Sneathiella sp.]
MTPPHIALVLVVTAIWGFAFVASKVGLDHFTPLFFTALRFFLVALILAPFLKRVKGSMKMVVWIALTVGIIHFTFLYFGIQAAGGVTAVAIATQLIAPFSLILAVIFLKETIGRWRILGIFLAFSGVMIIGFDPVIFDQLEGIALVTAGGLFMAIGLILMRQIQNVGSMNMQAWIAVLSAPPLLLMSLFVEQGQWADLMSIDWKTAGALAFIVVVTTIIGHGSWYYLLQRYPIATLTPYSLLAPVFGVTFGVVLFNEPITIKFLLGGALTLVGVAIINIRSASKDKLINQEPEF